MQVLVKIAFDAEQFKKPKWTLLEALKRAKPSLQKYIYSES